MGEGHGFTPPDGEVRAVFQPVEIHREDGTWRLGRINAWWTSPTGDVWCRLRAVGASAAWTPFDPGQVRLLPVSGL